MMEIMALQSFFDEYRRKEISGRKEKGLLISCGK
jgi:hypothetical protein